MRTSSEMGKATELQPISNDNYIQFLQQHGDMNANYARTPVLIQKQKTLFNTVVIIKQGTAYKRLRSHHTPT